MKKTLLSLAIISNLAYADYDFNSQPYNYTFSGKDMQTQSFNNYYTNTEISAVTLPNGNTATTTETYYKNGKIILTTDNEGNSVLIHTFSY